MAVVTNLVIPQEIILKLGEICEKQAVQECTEVSSVISLVLFLEALLLTQKGRTQAEKWSCCTEEFKSRYLKHLKLAGDDIR